MPPKADFPQYEAIKASLRKEGKPLAAAKTEAARISNARGYRVPPSHPRSRRKP